MSINRLNDRNKHHFDYRYGLTSGRYKSDVSVGCWADRVTRQSDSFEEAAWPPPGRQELDESKPAPVVDVVRDEKVPITAFYRTIV